MVLVLERSSFQDDLVFISSPRLGGVESPVEGFDYDSLSFRCSHFIAHEADANILHLAVSPRAESQQVLPLNPSKMAAPKAKSPW